MIFVVWLLLDFIAVDLVFFAASICAQVHDTLSLFLCIDHSMCATRHAMPCHATSSNFFTLWSKYNKSQTNRSTIAFYLPNTGSISLYVSVLSLCVLSFDVQVRSWYYYTEFPRQQRRKKKKQQQNVKLNAKIKWKKYDGWDWRLKCICMVLGWHFFLALFDLLSYGLSLCLHFLLFRCIVLLFDFNYFFSLFFVVDWLVFWTLRDWNYCERFCNGFGLRCWICSHSYDVFMCDENNHSNSNNSTTKWN